MTGRRLTIWQEMTTPHILPLAQALLRHFDRVRLITLGPLDKTRSAIGWQDVAGEGVEQGYAPTLAERRECLRGWLTAEDLHVLPGTKWQPWLWRIQAAVALSPAKIALLSEIPWPAKGRIARFALAARERAMARVWRGRIIGLFAIGETALDHFREAGFRSRQVHPFGYFPALRGDLPLVTSAGEAPVIAVAAALSPHKGIDVLIEALATCADRPWRLQIIGDGPERTALAQLAAARAIDDRIDWLGWRSYEDVPALLNASQLVVIPSRYDGWGAVVNEALGVGSPVIVSDGAGAHCVLTEPGLGERFACGEVANLASALHHQLDQPVTDARRQAVRSYAERALSPRAAAAYFYACVEGGSVLPPWAADPAPAQEPA